MATPNKNLATPANGSFVGIWDQPINTNTNAIDTVFGGRTSLNSTGLSGTQVLTTDQYTPQQIVVSGTPTAAITYQVPSGVGGWWYFENDTSGGFAVGLSSAAGGSTITVPAGQGTVTLCDGTASGMVLSNSVAPAAAGSDTQVQYNASGALAASGNFTFNQTTSTLTLVGPLVADGATTILGHNSSSSLTIRGTAIAAPNNLNVSSNSLFIDTTNKAIGVGTATLGSSKVVAQGVIESKTGGFKFPDATTQTTAAITTPTVISTPSAGTQRIGTLLIQWGQALNVAAGDTIVVPFTSTFSAGPYTVLIAPFSGFSGSGTSGLGAAVSYTTTGFSLFNGYPAMVSFNYLAIGLA